MMVDRRKLQGRIEEVLYEIRQFAPGTVTDDEDKMTTMAWLLSLSVENFLNETNGPREDA